jgi:hypothetical protein
MCGNTSHYTKDFPQNQPR